jgi:site-specific DNA recombinase
MRTAIYCRVSTDAQETEGTSLQTQLEACLKYCQGKGYAIAYQFSEVCSGLTLERPKLNELRELVRTHDVDAVVIHCLDRLSRDPVHGVIVTEELEKHNVSLEAVTETVKSTDLGKLISYVRGYAAKLEAQKIRERTMRGKRQRAEMGKIPSGGGGKLYGYRYIDEKSSDGKKGTRVENEAESKWVKQIFRWYTEDSVGLDQVALKLRALKVPSPRGGSWYHTTVRRLLTNEAYVGKTYVYKTKLDNKKMSVQQPQEQWVELPGATPAIIDLSTFQAAQDTLRRNKVLAKRNGKIDYLLRGYIRCARCHRAYWGYFKYRTERHTWRGYRCSGNLRTVTDQRCGNHTMNADKLESLTWAEVQKVISRPEIVISEIQRRGQEIDSPNSLKQRLEQLDIQLKHLKKREQRVYRIYEYCGDEPLLVKDMASIKTERQRLLDEKSQIESTLSKAHEIEQQRQGIEIFCDLVKSKLSLFTIEEKRRVLEALNIQITVDGENVIVSGAIPAVKVDVQKEGCIVEQPS